MFSVRQEVSEYLRVKRFSILIIVMFLFQERDCFIPPNTNEYDPVQNVVNNSNVQFTRWFPLAFPTIQQVINW